MPTLNNILYFLALMAFILILNTLLFSFSAALVGTASAAVAFTLLGGFKTFK